MGRSPVVLRASNANLMKIAVAELLLCTNTQRFLDCHHSEHGSTSLQPAGALSPGTPTALRSRQLPRLCTKQSRKQYLEFGVVNTGGKGQVVLDVEEHARTAIGVRQVCFLPVQKPNQWRHRKAKPQIPSCHSIAHLSMPAESEDSPKLGGQKHHRACEHR